MEVERSGGQLTPRDTEAVDDDVLATSPVDTELLWRILDMGEGIQAEVNNVAGGYAELAMWLRWQR